MNFPCDYQRNCILKNISKEDTYLNLFSHLKKGYKTVPESMATISDSKVHCYIYNCDCF